MAEHDSAHGSDGLTRARRAVARLTPGRPTTIPVALTDDGEAAYTRRGTIYLHPCIAGGDDPVLYGTIAHELAHILRRDRVRLTLHQVLVAAAGITLSVAMLELSFAAGAASALLAGITGRLTIARYERTCELAADAQGVRLLEQAGYSDGAATVAAALKAGGQRPSLAPQPSADLTGHVRARWRELADRWRAWDASHPSLQRRLAALDPQTTPKVNR